jgi:hypothetical protein
VARLEMLQPFNRRLVLFQYVRGVVPVDRVLLHQTQNNLKFNLNGPRVPLAHYPSNGLTAYLKFHYVRAAVPVDGVLVPQTQE